MAFKSLITNEVRNAFNLLQDLAEDITFTNNTSTSYDFSTGDVTEDANKTTTIIKGVISKMSKDVNDNTMIIAEVILKSEDASIIDIDNYDTINFRNRNWSINNVEDNGFAVTLTAARKV